MLFCYIGNELEGGDPSFATDNTMLWDLYLAPWLKVITRGLGGISTQLTADRNGHLSWYQIFYDVSHVQPNYLESGVMQHLKTIVDDYEVGVGVCLVSSAYRAPNGDYVKQDGGGLVVSEINEGERMPWWDGQHPAFSFIKIYLDAQCCGGSKYVVHDQFGKGMRQPVVASLYHELAHAYNVIAKGGRLDDETDATAAENILRLELPGEGGPFTGQEGRYRSDRWWDCNDRQQYFKDPQLYTDAGGCRVRSTQPINGCLIATAATNSPFSEEVEILRALRDGPIRSTEIGFDFFQRFFADYYRFSPAVSAMMLADTTLLEAIRDSLVLPLVFFFAVAKSRLPGDAGSPDSAPSLSSLRNRVARLGESDH